MGKNSREWRWKHRPLDLSLRFQRRLETAGFGAKVTFYGEFIKPNRITSNKVFQIETAAPYEVVAGAVKVGLIIELSHISSSIYQVWHHG